MTPPQRTPADLQDLVLGGPPRFTREELAAVTGVSLDEARLLWRAMGFADVGDARAFTDTDVTALLRVRSLVERGQLERDTLIEVTRSLGQTTARLADWLADAVGRQMVHRGEVDLRDGLQVEEITRIYDQTAELLPALERLLVHVFRRQVAAVMVRRLAEADEEGDEGPAAAATVGFADLVGFTRLARQLDNSDLARLVARFESVSADVVAETGARLVKTLGDEVLFVAEDPAQAAETALRLHEVHARHADVPGMRLGLATGEVVTRMGDVFGATVNLASRLTAVARPGSTLTDATTAHELQADRRFALRPLAPRPVRGVGIIRPYVLTRA